MLNKIRTRRFITYLDNLQNKQEQILNLQELLSFFLLFLSFFSLFLLKDLEFFFQISSSRGEGGNRGVSLKNRRQSLHKVLSSSLLSTIHLMLLLFQVQRPYFSFNACLPNTLRSILVFCFVFQLVTN